MLPIQFIAKLLNHGYAIRDWDEESIEISLSKDDKLIRIHQKEFYYFFDYWNESKKRWLGNSPELR